MHRTGVHEFLLRSPEIPTTSVALGRIFKKRHVAHQSHLLAQHDWNIYSRLEVFCSMLFKVVLDFDFTRAQKEGTMYLNNLADTYCLGFPAIVHGRISEAHVVLPNVRFTSKYIRISATSFQSVFRSTSGIVMFIGS